MSEDTGTVVDRAARGAYIPRGFTIELCDPGFSRPRTGGS